MSQKTKIARKWKRILKTPAELILKQKYDATQELKEQMSAKIVTNEVHEH